MPEAGSKREIRVHNKSDKPDNIVLKQELIEQECSDIQAEFPSFMRGFFMYLRSNLLPLSRLAYLRDIRVFFNYLINETDLTQAKDIKEIKQNEIAEIRASDVNMYLDYMRNYRVEKDGVDVGYVTSGAYSPTFKKGLAMALLSSGAVQVDSEVDVVIRDKRVRAKIVKLPFYKR